MSVQMQPADLNSADAEEIRESTRRWVQFALDRDFDGLTNELLAEDIQMMPPDHPLCTGRAACLAYLNEYPKIERFSLPIEDLTGGADIAIVRGTFDITVNIEGNSIDSVGKWLATYRKGSSGWLMVHDQWNADAPMA